MPVRRLFDARLLMPWPVNAPHMSARLPHTLVLHGLTRLSVDLHLRASSSGVSAVPPVPPVAPFVFGLRAHLGSSLLDA